MNFTEKSHSVKHSVKGKLMQANKVLTCLSMIIRCIITDHQRRKDVLNE